LYNVIILYNVFTPTRNAVDLSMHDTNKQHRHMKEHGHICCMRR